MEEISAHLLKSNSSSASQNATEGGSGKSEVRAVRFKRNLFMFEAGTGQNLDKHHRPDGEKSTEIDFGEPLRRQYEDFLHNYLTNLTELKGMADPLNPHKTLLDSILSGHSHEYDKKILSALCDKETLTPNIDKIRSFLQQSDGWKITTQLLEHQTALELFAAGLHAAVNPAGERNHIIEPTTVHLGINQGVLNKFRHETLAPAVDTLRDAAGRIITRVGRANRREVAGGIAAGLATGIAAEIAERAIAGPGYRGAAAAVIAAEAALLPIISSWTKEGVTLNLQQCAAAFNVIKGDAAEAAYVKAIAGIDVDNYQVVGANQIELVPGRIPEGVKSSEDVQGEILQKLYLRLQFYQKLGVPRERLDVLPEQFLYLYSDHTPEQTGTRMQEDILNRFNINEGGIQDAEGKARNDPDFGYETELVDPTDPTSGHVRRTVGGADVPIGMDIEGNLKRYMQARREYLSFSLGEFIRKEEAKKETSQEAINTITANIAARKEGGALFEEKKKGFILEKTELEKQKQILETQQNEVQLYQDSKKKLRDAEARLQELKVASSSATDIDKAIVERKERINPGITGSIPNQIGERNERMYRNIEDRTSRLSEPKGKEGAATYGFMEKIIRESEQSSRELDVADLNKEKTIVENEIKELNELKVKLAELNKEIHDAPHMKASDELVDSMQQAQTEILSWQTVLISAGYPDVGLTQAALIGESIEKIMERINAAHVLHNTLGWPASENAKPERRMQVINAQNNANAQLIEVVDARYPKRVDDYNMIRGFRIDASLLRTSTEAQVMHLINEVHHRTGGMVGWDSSLNSKTDVQETVRNAIREAKSRVEIRYDARPKLLANEIMGYTKSISDKEGEIGKVGESFLDVAQTLQTSLDLLERQSKIRQGASEILFNPEKFFDHREVDTDDRTITEAEKVEYGGSRLSRGYLEFMNLLFDYRNKTNSNKYFEKVMNLLPPEKFARLLDTFILKTFNLGAFTPRADLNDVFADLEARTGDTLSFTDFPQAFRLINEEIKAEALALS